MARTKTVTMKQFEKLNRLRTIESRDPIIRNLGKVRHIPIPRKMPKKP